MARGSLGKLASRALSIAGKWQHQQLRRLNIHEYQGAKLLGKYGINVPRGVATGSVQGIKDALKNIFPSEKEAEREFKVEVEAIGRVWHKNLVRLLGYCAEGNQRYLLVNLVEWLKTMVSNKNSEGGLDPKMTEKPTSRALKKALLVALRCADPKARKRPKIGHVIHMLGVDDFPYRYVEILKDDWIEVLNTELKRRIKMAVVLMATVVLAFMLA